jgi:hypothetical protein
MVHGFMKINYGDACGYVAVRPTGRGFPQPMEATAYLRMEHLICSPRPSMHYFLIYSGIHMRTVLLCFMQSLSAITYRKETMVSFSAKICTVIHEAS